MKLYVAGCGNAFSLKGKFHSCYVFENTETKKLLMFDCGFSAPVNLNQLPLNLQNLTCIFITHLHGDHFGGLSTLLLNFIFIQSFKEDLTIVGPPSIKKVVLDSFERDYPDVIKNAHFKLNFVELMPGDSHSVGDIDFQTQRADHIDAIENSALMVKARWNGKTFAFSGDTRWMDSIPPFFKDTQLTILECGIKERNQSIEHVSYEEICENKEKFKGIPLYLTHLPESLLDEDLIFPKLNDGQIITF